MLGPLAISADEVWGCNRRWVKHRIWHEFVSVHAKLILWRPVEEPALHCPEWLTLPMPLFFEHFQQIEGHHISSSSWTVFIQSFQSLGPLVWGLSFERWSLASWSDCHSQMITKIRKLHHHPTTHPEVRISGWRSVQNDDVARQSPYTKHSTQFFLRLIKPHQVSI